MSNKPDFIVDPSGNVKDVRGSKNGSASQSYSSQNSGTRVQSSSKNQSTSGGVTIIPIGLILTLILTLCRLLAAGTSARDPALSFPIRWIRWSECHLASPELMVDDLFNWNPASPPGRFQLWPHREV